MGMATKKHHLILACACSISFFAGLFVDKALPGHRLDPPFLETTTRGVVAELSATTIAATAYKEPPTEKGRNNQTSSTDFFDQIVQEAYQRVTKQKKTLPRNAFDITFWEDRKLLDFRFWKKHSGLTTKGGLQRLDRILLAKIYSGASSVFEYGLGESTYLANYLGVPRYAGIDSDPGWVNAAREKVDHSYRFYFADIGETKGWGYPKETLPKNVLDYQLAPLLVEQQAFDGRYLLLGQNALVVLH